MIKEFFNRLKTKAIPIADNVGIPMSDRLTVGIGTPLDEDSVQYETLLERFREKKADNKRLLDENKKLIDERNYVVAENSHLKLEIFQLKAKLLKK